MRFTFAWRRLLQEQNLPNKTVKEETERFLTFLGLCRRAGKTVHGTPLVCEALAKRRPPCLVLLSAGASAATAKRITDKCRFYRVPLIVVPVDTACLAKAVGKDCALAAVAVMDENFARELRNLHVKGKASSETEDDG